MKKIIILLLMSLVLFSCHQKRKTQPASDDFYVIKGDFDMSRFPLIKPYEVATVIPSDEWIIRSVDYHETLGTVPGTKQINVIDS